MPSAERTLKRRAGDVTISKTDGRFILQGSSFKGLSLAGGGGKESATPLCLRL